MRNNLIYFIITVILLKISLEFEPPPDFCENLWRRCNEKHPYCILRKENGSLQYETENGYPKKIRHSSHMVDKLVRLFNYFRNTFACGDPAFRNLNNDVFPKAARMQSVIWSDELEWLSEFFVHSRFLETAPHCILSPNYRNCTFFVTFESRGYFHINISMGRTFLFPYPGFLVLKPTSIDHYRQKDPVLPFDIQNDQIRQIGLAGTLISQEVIKEQSFLWSQLLSENATKFGCTTAILGFEDGKFKLTTACVFNEMTRRKEIFQKSDIAGSGCTELHPQFKCLCMSEFEDTADATTETDDEIGSTPEGSFIVDFDEPEEVSCPPRTTKDCGVQ